MIDRAAAPALLLDALWVPSASSLLRWSTGSRTTSPDPLLANKRCAAMRGWLLRAAGSDTTSQGTKLVIPDDSAPRAYAFATTSPTSTLSKVINSPGG
jgi:hypothetical protein